MGSFVTRTAGDVISEILMSRTAFDGSFLVVEGDSDSKLFSRYMTNNHSQIVIAGGKTTVCGAILGVYDKGMIGILGVIDNDYDSLCGIPIPSPHIVRTDSRDIESLLLKSAALELVINEFGAREKIVAFEASEGMTVREALVKRALIFGKLRLLNKQNNWNLNFNNLRVWRFGDVHTWTIDESKVISDVSRQLKISSAALSQSLCAISVHDPFVILHGRDTADILAMGLKNKLGNGQIHVKQVCQMLRLAFDTAMTAACPLFQRIRDWETINAPYRVLA